MDDEGGKVADVLLSDPVDVEVILCSPFFVREVVVSVFDVDGIGASVVELSKEVVSCEMLSDDDDGVGSSDDDDGVGCSVDDDGVGSSAGDDGVGSTDADADADGSPEGEVEVSSAGEEDAGDDSGEGVASPVGDGSDGLSSDEEDGGVILSVSDDGDDDDEESSVGDDLEPLSSLDEEAGSLAGIVGVEWDLSVLDGGVELSIDESVGLSGFDLVEVLRKKKSMSPKTQAVRTPTIQLTFPLLGPSSLLCWCTIHRRVK
ncbi:hypothetical protein [Absidia glauca]|uniref:Uncharacterized protein n=1 Tax=Absidia glauca TaxID=4829 RepID=A0A168SMM4_ABSGL|nr:hypothetical protein [Absidia glauca]